MRGDEHSGAAVAVDVDEQLHDVGGGGGVEVAGGFVGKNKGGVVDEGAGYTDALFLTLRELEGSSEGFVLDADGLEGVHDLVVDFRTFPSGGVENEGQVVVYVAVFEKTEVLENDAHFAAEEWDVAAFDVHEVESTYGGFLTALNFVVGVEGSQQ